MILALRSSHFGGRMLWLGYKMSPKGSCVEILVPNVTIFRVGVLGDNWIMKTLFLPVDESIQGFVI